MRLNSGLVNINGRIHIRKTINGRRIQKSTGIPCKREFYAAANKLLRELEADAYSGTRQPKTCEEGAIRYLGRCESKSTGTLGRAKTGLNNILNFRLEDKRYIRDVYLHDVRYGMIEEFIDASRETRWAGGVAVDIAQFKRMLRCAAEDWHDAMGRTWIDKVPKLPLPKGPKKKDTVLSPEQERALISEMPVSLQPMALFAIHTGCRTGEIEGLKWAHYREKDEIAYFSLPTTLTKTSRERPVVLNKSARQIIENQRGRNGEYVFASRRLNTREMGKAWKAAGLPMGREYKKGPHNFRHTTAARLRDAGVPKWTVEDVLGHQSGDVTRLYAVPTLEALLEAVEAPYVVRNWCDRPRASFNPLT